MVVFDTNNSQSSVAMHLRCGGIFNNSFTANYVEKSGNARISKISPQSIDDVMTKLGSILFWLTVYIRVYYMQKLCTKTYSALTLLIGNRKVTWPVKILPQQFPEVAFGDKRNH